MWYTPSLPQRGGIFPLMTGASSILRLSRWVAGAVPVAELDVGVLADAGQQEGTQGLFWAPGLARPPVVRVEPAPKRSWSAIVRRLRSPARDFFVSMVWGRDCGCGGGDGGAGGGLRHPYGVPGHHEGPALNGLGSECQLTILTIGLAGTSQPPLCGKSIGASC